MTIGVRRALGVGACAGLWLLTLAATAHAHGGMAGPDEMGPPIISSGILGALGYWAMMLWPSHKHRRGEAETDARPIERKQTKPKASLIR